MHVRTMGQVFKMISSWANTLKCVKHKVDMAYQSKKYM